MKIDKILFSCSEEYSDFWNLNSKIYKQIFNIEPVCLFFGDRQKTDLSDEYGKIINYKYIENLPKIFQLTWSKFAHTVSEPETVWMIGDIDQLPLNKFWFTENILDIDENYYLHLNSTACAENRNLPNDSFIRGLCNLPAHYHIAKGKIFNEFLNLSNSFENQISEIISSKIGNLNKLNEIEDHTSFFWCEEENVTSNRLLQKYHTNRIKLFGYNNKQNKICRSRFDYTANNYIYCEKKLLNGGYIDIHCERPFKKTETQILNILKKVWPDLF